MNLVARNPMHREAFAGDLVIRAVPRWEVFERPRKVQLYVVQEPFTYHSRHYDVTFTVPAGFETDFGSVPTLTKWLVDDDDPDLVELKQACVGLSEMRISRT